MNPLQIYNRKTPFYLYDLALLDRTIQALLSAAAPYNYHIHYALKANTNPQILSKICASGLGADCVSGAEVQRAVESGFAPSKIVLAGVGKTDEEILVALSHQIFCFNCESLQEIEVINELAGQVGKKARIALRINPNIDAKTHKYITTGLEENKFGIDLSLLDQVLVLLGHCKNIELIGLHFHIGSQITDLAVFEQLATKVSFIYKEFAAKGYQLNLINLGGGLGINYFAPDQAPIADFQGYFQSIAQFLDLPQNVEVHFELGRSIVGQVGTLVSKVLYIKEGISKKFVVLDAGMTELLRPALYQAHHQIENISAKEQNLLMTYDVVGPVCESSDCFGKSVCLPESKRGDLFAIRSAGAYGEVMASAYNLRSLCPSLYLYDNQVFDAHQLEEVNTLEEIFA